MTDVVVALLLLVGGAVFFLLRVMATEVVKQEYTRWAPALARLLVRLAGRIHPARAEEWWADVRYLQTDRQPSSGLWEAFSHVCGAPGLTVRAILITLTAAVARARAQGTRWFDREPISMSIATAFTLGGFLVDALTIDVTGFGLIRGSVLGQAYLVFLAAGVLFALTGLTLRLARALTPRRHAGHKNRL